MLIESLKKLADTRQIETDLSLDISMKIENKIKKLIDVISNDFDKFFKENGFKLENEKSLKNKIVKTASYNNLKNIFSYDDPSKIKFIGKSFTSNLELNTLRINKYIVTLIKIDPPIKPINNESQQTIGSSEIQKEIEATENNIKKLKSEIANLDNIVWMLQLERDPSQINQFSQINKLNTSKNNQNSNIPIREKFKSMYELLTKKFSEQ